MNNYDNSDSRVHLTDQVVGSGGYPRCPVCGSYEVTRHSEMFKVWFTCRRCNAVFS
jgi:hypothetical protein